MTADGVSLERAHLVGVGGAGMSGIARILADRGYAVSGSDARDSPVLAGLAARGVLTAVGHDAANLQLLAGGPTAVVVSTAVRPDNPEVVAAREAGIPVVRRADALAALMTGYRGVCIAGTHGKTSTTSMLTVALQHAGLDPSFAIGGELTGSGLGAHHGERGHLRRRGRRVGRLVPLLHPARRGRSPTSNPTIWTTTAPPRPTRRCSTSSSTGSNPAGSWSPAPTIPARPRWPIGSGCGGWSPTAVRPSATVRLLDHRPSGAPVVLVDGREIELVLSVPGDHMLLNAVAALAAGVELGVDAAD